MLKMKDYYGLLAQAENKFQPELVMITIYDAKKTDKFLKAPSQELYNDSVLLDVSKDEFLDKYQEKFASYKVVGAPAIYMEDLKETYPEVQESQPTLFCVFYVEGV